MTKALKPNLIPC